MGIKEVLKREAELIFAICVIIIADVFPVILIMAGIWIVRYFSKLFGFEELAPVRIIILFEEIFMILLYLGIVVYTVASTYKLFKEGKL